MERPTLSHPLTLPALSAAQMGTVLRLLVEEYCILPQQIIENMGQSLALLAQHLLAGEIVDRPIVVLAGRGQKGASGLAAARHLLASGAWVQVVLAHPPAEHGNVSADQLAALQAMSAPLAWAEEGWELPPTDLVIDALIGCGLRGDPHGKVRDLIHLANSSVAPILSLTTPSGLDMNTGQRSTPYIQASATLMLALPNAALLREPGRSACGDLYLADIGVPPQLYHQVGLAVPPIFGRDTIIPLAVENGIGRVSEQSMSLK